MLERSRERRQALHILYQREVTGQPVSRILGEKTYIVEEDGEPGEFCAVLATGAEEHMTEIDQRISTVSEHWVVSRMPLVDRNILRMAVFELIYLDDVPASVTINEAVELAKTFGGEDSSKFVNGVLGRIADQQTHSGPSTENDDG
jgi:N utilization substance protein B